MLASKLYLANKIQIILESKAYVVVHGRLRGFEAVILPIPLLLEISKSYQANGKSMVVMKVVLSLYPTLRYSPAPFVRHPSSDMKSWRFSFGTPAIYCYHLPGTSIFEKREEFSSELEFASLLICTFNYRPVSELPIA